MSSTVIEPTSLEYGDWGDMSLPYNDLAPDVPDRRGFTSHANSPTERRPQHPPLMRSELTNSSDQVLVQPHWPSTTVSQRIDRGADLNTSRISLTPFSPAHLTPSSLDRRLHPTNILNPTPDYNPPLYPKEPQRLIPSSKLLSNDNQEQNQAVTPTKVLPNRKGEPQAQPSTQSQKAQIGRGMSSIPNLLGPDRAETVNSIMFRLSMRQQPQAARACGFGDRDRRVIDPPPIVQLYIDGPSLSKDEARSYLRFESYVMNCSICDESGTQDASFMPEEYQHQRRLMGSLVGTPFVGQDDHGEEGCFFCFSDLSCRTPGAFRLKFTLIMIDPARAGMIRHFPVLTEIVSDVFHVYSAKEFPGMLPSSNLAKRLKEQGCIISIKKGNDRHKNARGQDELSHDEEAGEGSQGQRKRRTIRD